MGKNNGKKKRKIFLGAISVFIITLVLAFAISIFTQTVMANISSISIAFILLITIILLGIIFDIIGIAATAATEAPFHAKASKRVFGAAQALKLIRNADKVANFSNDVVGDISGTISGALGIAITYQILASHPTSYEVYFTTLMTAVIAALTVSGKAIGKSIGFRNANSIIFKVGKLWAVWEKPMAFFGIHNDRKRGI